MRRRRLQLVYSSSSSDDEDETLQRRRRRQQQQQPQQDQNHRQELQRAGEMMLDDDNDEEEAKEEFEVEVESRESFPNIAAVTLESSPSPNFSDAAEMLLSDEPEENFIDVSENFSPSSPMTTREDGSVNVPPPPPAVVVVEVSSSSEGIDCPVREYLRGLGLSLKREWASSCVRRLEGAVPGFCDLDVATKGRMCFGEFLFADMNSIGAGVLPENVDSLHLVHLPGPFVLQVDEIVNIGSSLRQRYQDAPAGLKRCLKLSMTDGVQRVFGMEYRPIKDLEVLSSAGFKVVLRDVTIRRGLLMLVPETLDVLGGFVEQLEAARQRLVYEVNKPPRGRRSRTGVVPDLATRATAAAWQPCGFSHPTTTNVSTLGPHRDVNAFANISTTHSSASSCEVDRGPSLAVGDDGLKIIKETSVPIGGGAAGPNVDSSTVHDVEDELMVDQVEHPFILNGDKELPFTYLASLSARWASLKEHEPCVRGKIKCFLTGVKGFQYKQRTTFELCVYVDDGSLISEILIHHDVVQKGIGYSPEEVNASLTSSDTISVSSMKETLKQFQIFLVNFEGTMLVEMNNESPVPVAFEMDQGCPASDAWLLIQRLGTLGYLSGEACQNNESDPINLSP